MDGNSTIFSLILSGEIPSHKVYEDDFVYAFLDINPLSRAHISNSKRSTDNGRTICKRSIVSRFCITKNLQSNYESYRCERLQYYSEQWRKRGPDGPSPSFPYYPPVILIQNIHFSGILI